jgi:hypothetical protein
MLKNLLGERDAGLDSHGSHPRAVYWIGSATGKECGKNEKARPKLAGTAV